MAFSMTVQKGGGIWIVNLSGKIALQSELYTRRPTRQQPAHQLFDKIQYWSGLKNQKVRVIINCSGIRSIDTYGILLLQRIQEVIDQADGRCRILGANRHLRQSVQQQLAASHQLYASRRWAIRSFRKAA